MAAPGATGDSDLKHLSTRPHASPPPSSNRRPPSIGSSPLRGRESAQKSPTPEDSLQQRDESIFAAQTFENGISAHPHMENLRRRLGLHPTVPIVEEHDEAPHNELFWSKVKLLLREPFAEFWGVFILIAFGDGAVAQVLLSTNDASAPGGMGFGGYQSISWGSVASEALRPTYANSIQLGCWHHARYLRCW